MAPKPGYGERIEWRGESKPLVRWAEELGIDQATLRERVRRWGIERAMTEPPHKSGKRRDGSEQAWATVTWNGETRLISEWANELGINPCALYHRLHHWPIERAMTEPPNDTGRRATRTHSGMSWDDAMQYYDMAKAVASKFAHKGGCPEYTDDLAHDLMLELVTEVNPEHAQHAGYIYVALCHEAASILFRPADVRERTHWSFDDELDS